MLELTKMLASGVKRWICSSTPGIPAETVSIQESVHPEMEFMFVIRGENRFLMNKNFYEAKPGDIFVIEPWVTHAFGYFRNDHDLLHLWLHLYQDHRFEGNCILVERDGYFKSYLAPIKLSYDVADLFKRRWHMMKQEKSTLSAESLNKYLQIPFKLVFDEILLSLSQENFTESVGRKKQIIDAVKQYIHSSHGYRCSLSDIETYTGYNRYYVAHLFKQTTGLTIGEYVNDMRIRYLADAEMHNMKHKAIAEALGFSSLSAFCLWQNKNKIKINELAGQLRDGKAVKSEEKK